MHNDILMEYKYVLFVLVFFCFQNDNQVYSQKNCLLKKDTSKTIVWNEHRNKVYVNGIKRGIGVFSKPMNIKYRRGTDNRFYVEIGKPILVYQAKETVGWGFVQFPRLFRNDSAKLAVVWNMHEDDIRAKRKTVWKYSKDLGSTWFFRHKERPLDKGLLLSNGNRLKFFSKSYKEEELDLIPLKYKSENNDSLFNTGDYKFYRLENVPDSLRCFNKIEKSDITSAKSCSPVTYFPKTLKYSNKGIFPNQLWGKLARLDDSTLLTCQYPYFNEKENGQIGLSGVGFFQSKDDGISWTQISDIPFYADKRYDGENSSKRSFLGYTEPIFQVLENNKIICILRSAPTYEAAPMYMAVSDDLGITWSKPKVITNNGVLPQLLLLSNNVLVLSYGRPGVQIRFLDANNDSLVWSDPIEMLRFEKLKGQVSCGYTNLLATSDNSFLITYSDFRGRDEENNIRKSILVRKISIDNFKTE